MMLHKQCIFQRSKFRQIPREATNFQCQQYILKVADRLVLQKLSR